MRRFRRRVARVRRRTGRFRKSRSRFPRRFKKRTGARKTTLVLRNRTIIPDQCFAKIRYTDFTAIGATGTPGGQNYFGNGIYKPKNTTGANPFGCTEYVALYSSYNVIASSIKVTFNNNNGIDCLVMVWPDDSTGSYVPSGFSTLNLINGIPYARHQWLTGVSSASAGAFAGVRSIKHYMQTEKIEGVSKRRVLDDDLYMGSINVSNPSKTWNWWVAVAPVDLTSVYSVNCMVEVVYYVKFFQRVDFTS